MICSRQAIRLLSRQQQQQQQQSKIILAGVRHPTAAAAGTAGANTFSSSSSSVAPPSLSWTSTSNATTSPSSSSSRWFSSTSTSSTGSKDEAKEAADASENETEETVEEEQGPSVEDLQKEVKTMKDQLLRSYAEQENTRNIAKRDVTEARQFAIKSFAKSLLEVADNLQRALDSVPEDELTDATAEANASLIALQQGIDMTNQGLLKALSQHGVEKYCQTPGDKFDPSLHNALMQYPDENGQDGHVGQVINVGYTLNQRVLRPAEVGVIKK
jgi:molecular chaperone GrpE